jgi:hypothetical protein
MLKKIFDALRSRIIVRMDVVGHIAAFDGTRNHIAYLCKSDSIREVSGVLKVNRLTGVGQFVPNLQSYYVMKTVRLAYPGQHEIAVGLPQDVSDNWCIARAVKSVSKGWVAQIDDTLQTHLIHRVEFREFRMNPPAEQLATR